MSKVGKSIVLRSGIFIPTKFLSDGVEEALDTYTKHMFEEHACTGCAFKVDRPCAECETCDRDGYKGSIATAKVFRNDHGKYLKVPTGDIDAIEQKLSIDLSEHNVIDLRTKRKLKHKWKFTGELRDYQKKVQKSWIEHGYGLLKSAPRTGKTVMAIANAIKQGLRVVILADQKDFLDGFYETIESLTNALEIEEVKGKKIFGFLKKEDDYNNFDIGLLTYQSLISSNGKARRKLLNDNFAVLIIDEVHAANATEYSRVISRLKMTHKYGLTATPERKDGRDFLVQQLIGPITASTSVKAMTPTVYCHKLPPVKFRKGQQFAGKAGFSRLVTKLSDDKARNEYLLKCLIHDVKKGHSVCFPCMRKSQVTYFVDALNNYFGKRIAASFIGGTKEAKIRKQVVDDARAGAIKVVVGIRSLMQRGINIPEWTCHYYQMPMNNKSNWEQESNRICTPLEGKRTPIIRLFVDLNPSMAISCWRSTVEHSKLFGHKFSPTAKDLVAELGSAKTQRMVCTEDVYGVGEENSSRASSFKKRKLPTLLDHLDDGPLSL